MSAAPLPNFYRMTLSEFARQMFVGKPPSRNTLKAMIERQQWQGEKVGGMYFVFVDAKGQPIPGNGPQTGNRKADRFIMTWAKGKD